MDGNTGNTGTTNVGPFSRDQITGLVMKGYDAVHTGESFNALPPQRQAALVDLVIGQIAGKNTTGDLADTAKGISPKEQDVTRFVLAGLRKDSRWDEDEYVAGLYSPATNTGAPGKEILAQSAR
jgi:hypothetical protein